MEYVRVRGTSIDVSRVGLGTWAIGGLLWGGTQESDALRTIAAALDRGITLIDTAPIYGFGASEQIVGKALAEQGRRSSTVIATKLGLSWHQDKVFRDTRARRIHAEVEDSLRRLRTDYIDIYQVHWPDVHTPAEETASALVRLLEEGKIRAIGVSNYDPDQLHAFARVAPLHAVQPPYNIFEREIESDVLPACRALGVSTLMYGALCRGLLSGRMRHDSVFKGDDIRKLDPKFRDPRYAQYLKAVAQLEGFAAALGKSVLQLAVRWVLDRPDSDVALWGARTPEQLEPVDGVMGWSLDHASMDTISNMVAASVSDPVGPSFMAPPARAP